MATGIRRKIRYNALMVELCDTILEHLMEIDTLSEGQSPVVDKYKSIFTEHMQMTKKMYETFRDEL